MQVTFWSTTCRFFFPRLHVGDPIAVCTYTKKKTLNEGAGGDGTSYEVAINPRDKRQNGGGADAADCPYQVRKMDSEACELLGLSALNSPFRIVSSRLVCQLQVSPMTLSPTKETTCR